MSRHQVNHNLWHGHNSRRLRLHLFLHASAIGLINLAAAWLILSGGFL